MIDCIMVIAVGEEDNNKYSTEFFRVMKGIVLSIPPQVGTFIEYAYEKNFYIEVLQQAPIYGQTYLYMNFFVSPYKYHGDKKLYDKLEREYIKEGWSKTRGGFKLMSTTYKENKNEEKN